MMCELLVEGGERLYGELTIQGSKNSVLPILAATLLCADTCVIENCPKLRDVDASVAILRHLGCCTHWEDSALVVDTARMDRAVVPDALMREMRSSVIFLGAILARCKEATICYPGGCELGPRPIDLHLAALRKLGVEIEENSELDLLVSYKTHAGDARIPSVCEDMKKEMGEGKYYADMLERMAQFELTLLDWAEGHKGARKYVAFADKCWPAFPEQFGFEPCYVNSRLASRGIPVACEVDIYGALSEYIGACISYDAVTLLDINNSVPASLYEAEIKGKFDYTLTDTFMGFHCGNTPSCKLCADRAVKYQLIQHRLLEPAGSEPDFTRGTLEADLAASQITFYRLQCDSDGVLRSYIAEGEILPVHTGSFGGIGIFAIPEMGRFYRHVLVQKRYPHHGAVAFGHYGKLLFEVFKFLGVGDIAYNQPKSLPYPTENPFA